MRPSNGICLANSSYSLIRRVRYIVEDTTDIGGGRMNRLSQAGQHGIAELLARADLHRPGVLPVSIRQLARDEGWRVFYTERLWPLYGFAVVKGMTRLMWVNADVAPAYQRFAIAHEMGHVLLEAGDALHLCSPAQTGFSRWVRQRAERQASIVAAHLLIPAWVPDDVESRAAIAHACEVPEELVALRFG